MRGGRLLVLGCLVAIGSLSVGPAAGAAQEKYRRTVEDYTVPDVTLVDQDGEKVNLRALASSEKPVLLDFIYGTCTTICPVLSAGYAYFQRKMGEAAADKAVLISISIDPDHDTPLIMTDYLRRYGAKPGWEFLTGKREDVIQVMYAFDAYVENKMNHYPLTLLRAPGSDRWIRIYGLIGGKDLMREYERLAGDP
ncbi:MAG: SCO family protein [Deferrisomatales bacterium]